MKKIKLTQSRFAIVDDQDYEWLSKYKWCAQLHNGNWYALRTDYSTGKQITISMHREILGLKHNDGKITDHSNNNSLDNRKCNLRICSYSQNQQNKEYQKHSSKYKGVSWCKASKKWRSDIGWMGKHYYLGLFDNEKEAARTYDFKAKNVFGKFAKLNFRGVENG